MFGKKPKEGDAASFPKDVTRVLEAQTEAMVAMTKTLTDLAARTLVLEEIIVAANLASKEDIDRRVEDTVSRLDIIRHGGKDG